MIWCEMILKGREMQRLCAQGAPGGDYGASDGARREEESLSGDDHPRVLYLEAFELRVESGEHESVGVSPRRQSDGANALHTLQNSAKYSALSVSRRRRWRGSGSKFCCFATPDSIRP